MNRKKKLKEWPHIWTAVFLILGRITLYHRNCAYSVNIIWKINHLMSGYILLFLEFQKSSKDKSIWHGWSWCWVLFTWILRLLIRLSNLEMVQGFCVRHLSSINKGGPRLFYRGDAGISRQGAGTTMPQWQQSQTAPVCGAVRDGMKMGCLFWFQSSFNVSDRLGVLIICRSFFSSSLVSCLCGFHHILSHSFTGSLSSYLDHVCVCEQKKLHQWLQGVSLD